MTNPDSFSTTGVVTLGDVRRAIAGLPDDVVLDIRMTDESFGEFSPLLVDLVRDRTADGSPRLVFLAERVDPDDGDWSAGLAPDIDDDDDDWGDDDSEIDRMNDRLDAAMAARIEHETRLAGDGESVIGYEAYDEDDAGLFVDNLDKVAVYGQVVLVYRVGRDAVRPGFKPFVSAVLENPTWMQVAVLASRAVRTTGSFDHVFLEGVEPFQGYMLEPSGVQVYRLVMGS